MRCAYFITTFSPKCLFYSYARKSFKWPGILRVLWDRRSGSTSSILSCVSYSGSQFGCFDLPHFHLLHSRAVRLLKYQQRGDSLPEVPTVCQTQIRTTMVLYLKTLTNPNREGTSERCQWNPYLIYREQASQLVLAQL